MGLGFTELLVILVIVLVLFGAGRLTRSMGDLGKGLRAFKDGLKEEDTTKKE
ncbi:MAG: twin-arginine translocase TatA/TatE family subunit [Alphaproteobacteria bacterium]|nr:twin-arginine translocase TatA/TatE family subunit [Alphaproteobacteria bacterium]